MGTVLGRISVETPKYHVVAQGPDYEIREYEPSIAAQVTYDPSTMKSGRDGGFMILANFIGAVGKPGNVKPQKNNMTQTQGDGEKIAMTASVITQESSNDTNEIEGEKIAMTAPVIIYEGSKDTNEIEGEKIAMTAPVITQEGGSESGERKKLVTMQFILPSVYTMENVPRPSDPRVSIKEMPRRKYGVVTFSGIANENVVNNMVEKLRKSLKDGGYHVVGDYVLARYNPPWTLSFLRTNEVMQPVE